MKDLLCSIFFILICLCVSCSDNDSQNQAITVDSGQLDQTVYADVTQGNSGVRFSTTGAWTSSVDYIQTRATEDEQSDWIAISPDRGSVAGEYDVVITLGVNTTGKDRRAIIRILCNTDEMTIAIIQRGTKEDGTTPVPEPKPTPSVEDLFTQCVQSYSRVGEAWLQIDNQYSTLTSRQTITPESEFVYNFWQKSYACIYNSNLLLEQVEQSELSESVKASYRGKALASMATTYFYLKTLFGGVPLITDSETSESSVPRTSAGDVIHFAHNCYSTAIPLHADSTQVMMFAKSHLQEGNFNQVIELSTKLLSEYQFIFRDTNGDGIINGQDSNTNTTVVYLFLAEANVKLGNTSEAIQRVNQINLAYALEPSLSEGANAGAILTAIRNEYTKLVGTGMKFPNAVRWNDTQSWGYRALLPIPESELDRNPLLTQNMGW